MKPKQTVLMTLAAGTGLAVGLAGAEIPGLTRHTAIVGGWDRYRPGTTVGGGAGAVHDRRANRR